MSTKTIYYKHYSFFKRNRVWSVWAIRGAYEKCLWCHTECDPAWNPADFNVFEWHIPKEHGQNTIRELLQDVEQRKLWDEIDKKEAFMICL